MKKQPSELNLKETEILEKVTISLNIFFCTWQLSAKIKMSSMKHKSIMSIAVSYTVIMVLLFCRILEILLLLFSLNQPRLAMVTKSKRNYFFFMHKSVWGSRLRLESTGSIHQSDSDPGSCVSQHTHPCSRQPTEGSTLARTVLPGNYI